MKTILASLKQLVGSKSPRAKLERRSKLTLELFEDRITPTTASLVAQYTPAVIPTTFTNILSTGSQVTFIDSDNDASSIPIGFDFPFYGTTQTDVYVGTNGFLTFGTANQQYTNTPLSADSPGEAAILPYWNDFRISGSNSRILYQTIGTGASEVLVVQWNNMATNTDDGFGQTFEAVLGADGSIGFNYLTFGTSSGSFGTSGIINSDGSSFSQLEYNSNPTVPNAYFGPNVSVKYLYGLPIKTTADPLTFQVSIVSDSPTNGETVTVRDTSNSNALVGSAVLSSGLATVHASAGALSAGTHNLVAVYPGDGTNAPATSSPLPQVIATTLATTTTLSTSTANPSSTATPIVFSAHVNAPSGLAITGQSVIIHDASNSDAIVAATGNAVDASGNATITVVPGALTPGVHNLYGAYAGDGLNLPSVSTPNIARTVTISTTTTTLSTGNPNPSGIDIPVTFTVTVSGGAPPTGETVSLFDASNGNAAVATTGGVLDATGVATIIATAGQFSVGTHQIYAVYSATAYNLGSQSSHIAQTVTLDPSTTTLVGIYTAQPLAPTFTDIHTTGTVVPIGAGVDDSSILIPIGFIFPFYSGTYSNLYAGTNGTLMFGSANANYSNVSLGAANTSVPTQAFIAPLWDDGYISGAPDSNMFYQVVGSGASQQLIVEWWHSSFYADSTRSGDLVYEAVLGADGSIIFNYQNLTTSGVGGGDEGSGATVGVKDVGNTATTAYTQIDFNGTPPVPNAMVGSNRSVKFSFGLPNQRFQDDINFLVSVGTAGPARIKRCLA